MDAGLISHFFIVIINYFLTAIILILSYLGFRKSRDIRLLYLGIAFFVILVMPTILMYYFGNVLGDYETPYHITYLGYVLIVVALYKFWRD